MKPEDECSAELPCVDCPAADWSEVPCRIEGCGRCVVPYGDDVMCGLARIYGIDNPKIQGVAECGAEATIAKWERMGLFADDTVVNE